DTEYHFAPKVFGLAALEAALGDRQLDFCLLMSSLSAVLSGLKMIPYTAANLYMDAFTRRHNKTGAAPCLSVDWDTWRVREEQHGTIGKTVREFEKTLDEGMEALARL